MINVQAVDLQALGVILPADKVGVVIAQPHVCLSDVEPFQWPAAVRPEALQAISRTFSVAREASHGVGKTHFTVFPEYSIPGIEGVQAIEAEIAAAAWPCGTVVIGGVHGLAGADYAEILAQPGTHFDASCNGVAAVGHNQWVNCAITWVKNANAEVQRWIQPKLYPAWPEMAVQYQEMFRGGSVFVFQGPRDDGTTYRFATVVCFDWVATVGDKKTSSWILSSLHDEAPAGAEVALSWLFVIQRNPKPSHDTFLREVEPFFNQAHYARVRRGDACVVFANASGRAGVGGADEYGSTSLVFSHEARFNASECPPTFSNGGERYRGSTLLSSYRDVYFRERGSCILSFAQLNPRSLPAGAAGRALPLERAFVYPISGTSEPRAPGAPVPGIVKWFQDQLDDARGVSVNHQQATLAAEAAGICVEQVFALRQLSGQDTTTAIDIAVAAPTSRKKDSKMRSSDEWDQVEERAVAHILATMNILGLGRLFTVVHASAHATFESQGATLDLLAVIGRSHPECIEHAKRFSTGVPRQVVLVSRDAENSLWDKAFGSILQPQQGAVGDDIRITDPESSLLHVSYQQLLNVFLHSASVAGLAGGIDAELSA